jgi:urease accessory protein UreE
MTSSNISHNRRILVKKLDANHRLTVSLLARAPSFTVVAGALADRLSEVLLSTGETITLKLPNHTHLNPGDVLLDSKGMMVRIAAALQTVLAVQHKDTQKIVALALSAHKQGRALGWADGCLLLPEDASLVRYLNSEGFTLKIVQGKLAFNAGVESLPNPEQGCGHDHHSPEHTHEHIHHPESHTHHAH